MRKAASFPFSAVFGALTIALVCLLAVVAGAAAAPPEREPFEDEFIFPLAYCGDVDPAWDFFVLDRVVLRGFEDRFYNQDGIKVKVIAHFNGVDHVYVESTTSPIVTGSFAVYAKLSFDLVTGEYLGQHTSGIPTNIHLPGAGAVVHLSGTAFWDAEDNLIRMEGRSVENYEALCAYFAPFAP